MKSSTQNHLIRDVSVFYLFRHLTSKRADLARLGQELGGKLRGQLHLTVYPVLLNMNVLIVTGLPWRYHPEIALNGRR